MIQRDKVFETGNQENIWKRYCGFLDLTLPEFMEIQEQLLMEQIDLVSESNLAKKFMPNKPKDISEFRKTVPLTTYDDYAVFFNEQNEDVLAVKPYRWVHTSGRGGSFKWIPYTLKSLDVHARYGVSILILASARKKGEVNIRMGMRALHNMPPRPYSSGIFLEAMVQQIDMRPMPPLGDSENLTFEERTRLGFGMALRNGVDIMSSLTSVLIKMGESFTEGSGKMKLSRSMLHPQIMRRLLMAWLHSKWAHRNLLPKDLWPLKGLVGYGMDTGIYRKKLEYYWGENPLEMYACSESGPIATQAWNKQTMTFFPMNSFWEFIPEDEWLKWRDDHSYVPSPVLIDELEPGKLYEVVFSSFYGMPFMRYKTGDLIRIVALEDLEAGIKLPQMVFESRADDIIDIAGFTRLDEKAIWQAIANTGVKYEDWVIRKEYINNDEPILHLYIEPKEEIEASKLENLVHEKLVAVNRNYRDLENMLGIRPLRLDFLPRGAFQQYYKAKRKAGADLAHLKPAHVNPSDAILAELLELNKISSIGEMS